MDITIYPGKLHGNVTAIPSKSQAHRLLICAAFADRPTILDCPETNQDIEATARCLNALGASVSRTEMGYSVQPCREIPKTTTMDCGESGSTLRFILPIVCALGVETTIHMAGRLPYRPLSPLWEELEGMGCNLTRPTMTTIHTNGKLHAGEYTIAGNVSSQFITGLLFALSMLEGESKVTVTGTLQSRPYVEMTQKALADFSVDTTDFRVRGSLPFHSPGNIQVEGDWSNGAFFLVAAGMGNTVSVMNLNPDSPQGDRAVANLLKDSREKPVISAADIPDLVPILAVYFASKKGTVFTDIARLRLKESDRVASVTNLLHTLGIKAESDENTLTVYGGRFSGGVVDACSDHRIAMAAGIAATVADEPVTILGADCVAKSYPAFWQEYKRLGGKYEQHIR